jgi:TatD DNase family protein
LRGKRNEPAHVARVAERLAEVRGVPVGDIEQATSANFFRLFAKARAPATTA